MKLPFKYNTWVNALTAVTTQARSVHCAVWNQWNCDLVLWTDGASLQLLIVSYACLTRAASHIYSNLLQDFWPSKKALQLYSFNDHGASTELARVIMSLSKFVTVLVMSLHAKQVWKRSCSDRLQNRDKCRCTSKGLVSILLLTVCQCVCLSVWSVFYVYVVKQLFTSVGVHSQTVSSINTLLWDCEDSRQVTRLRVDSDGGDGATPVRRTALWDLPLGSALIRCVICSFGCWA